MPEDAAHRQPMPLAHDDVEAALEALRHVRAKVARLPVNDLLP